MSKARTLSPSRSNPRKASPAKVARLRDTMARLGDIGGIIFNARTGTLIGGNQRTGVIGKAVPVITERFDTPTKAGTVAVGYVDHKGERFTYREVEWDKQTEMEAIVAANVPVGEWDMDMLEADFDISDLHDWGLDVDAFDEDVTDALDNNGPAQDRDDTEEDQGDAAPTASTQNLFPLGIVVNKVQQLHWQQVKDQLGSARDSEAFIRLLDILKKNPDIIPAP